MESKIKIIFNLLFKKVEYIRKKENTLIIEQVRTPKVFIGELEVARHIYQLHGSKYFQKCIKRDLFENQEFLGFIDVEEDLSNPLFVKLRAEIKVL